MFCPKGQNADMSAPYGKRLLQSRPGLCPRDSLTRGWAACERVCPFTPPHGNPATKFFCARAKITQTGATTMVAQAIIRSILAAAVRVERRHAHREVNRSRLLTEISGQRKELYEAMNREDAQRRSSRTHHQRR